MKKIFYYNYKMSIILNTIVPELSDIEIGGNLNIGGNVVISGTLTASGITDVVHSSLSGLSADDHVQYSLLAGRSGGQILIGGTASGNNLTLNSTSNATKGSVLISETTASTSSITGALVVSGGVGIAGRVNFANGSSIIFPTDTANQNFPTTTTRSNGTKIVLYSNVNSTDVDFGFGIGPSSLWYSVGSLGRFHRFYHGTSNTMTLSGTSLEINHTTASTNTTTGALVVSGGVGVAGNLNVAGDIFVSGSGNPPTTTTRSTGTRIVLFDGVTLTNVDSAIGVEASSQWYSVNSLAHFHRFYHGTTNTVTMTGSTLQLNYTTASNDATTGALTVAGGVGIGGNLNVDGFVSFSNTTQSSDFISGSVVISGGVGIIKNMNIAGQVKIVNNTASTGATTGALVVSGGVGVIGALTIGYQGDGIGALSFTRSDGALSGGISFTNTGFSSVMRLTNASNNTGRIDFNAGTGGTYFSFGSNGTSTSSIFSITSTSASTSSTTGALRVSGGVGVGGALYVGANARIRATGNDGLIIDGLNPNANWFKATAGPTLSSYAIQIQVQNTGSPLFYTKVGTTYYVASVSSVSYFTGQHMCASDDFAQFETETLTGLIVYATGEYLSKNDLDGQDVSGINAISINESLPKIKLSITANDKRVFGVITDSNDSPTYDDNGNVVKDYHEHDYERRIFGRVRINSLGEGAVWVCNVNGNIENGDYITSCTVPGYGTVQADDLLHNYTVAKATCSIYFSNINSTLFQVRYLLADGTIVGTVEESVYTAVFIGCTYHCG